MIPRLTVAAAALLATLAAAAAPASVHAAEPGRHADRLAGLEPEPGVLLVAPEAGRDARALAARAGGSAGRRVAGTRFVRVRVDQAEANSVLHRLRRDPGVAGVQRNHARTAHAVPDDPLFGKGRQAYLETIRLPQALDLQANAAGRRIAVVDSGVDGDTPDLAGQLLPGRDLVDDDDDPEDRYGHGTRVAGVAAAATGNDRGIAGVASGASILPVRVLDGNGRGYDTDIAAGIVWAADQGAHVINVSLGGPAPSAILADAVAYARGEGAVVIAAAGNWAAPVRDYPAALPGVVAVTSTDWGGEFDFVSASGDWIDVAAPGYYLIGPTARPGPLEGYGRAHGTSFSAAVVSGIAALVGARNPGWSGEQVAGRLRASATDLGPPGIDPFYGHGLVDAFTALGGAAPPAQALPPADGNDVPDRATPLSGLAHGELSQQGDVDWWAFDIPRAGDYDITVDPTFAYRPRPNAMDVQWELYAPDQRFLHRENSYIVDTTESLRRYFASPGRYLLKVDNLARSRTPGRGSYRVDIEGHDHSTGEDPNPFAVTPPDLIKVPADIAETGVADVTGDGLPDVLAVTTQDGAFGWRDRYSLQVFAQTSEGWLLSPRRYDTGVHGGEPHLATGDVTGDGRLDAVVSTPEGVRLYRHVAGEGLREGVLQPGTAHSEHVEIADADGDGDRDVLYSTRAYSPAPTGVFLLAQTPDGLAAPRRLTAIAVDDGFTVGRLNGDARPDLALDTPEESGRSAIVVLRRAADGTYYANRIAYDARDLAIADVTGDGRQDLLASHEAFADNDLLVFAQSSSGWVGPLTRRIEDWAFEIAVGDAEGDGDADVATGGGLHLQQPGGVLTRLPGAGFGSHALTFADINGDGLADAVSANRDGIVPARRRGSRWPRPLWVRDTTPAPGTAGASTSVTPSLEFGRALDPASITAETVALRDAGTGAAVAAMRSYDAATRTITVRPSSALTAGRTYTVTVDGVRDTGGRVMGRDHGATRYDDGYVFIPPWMVVEPFELRFTAGRPPADTRPPQTWITGGPQGTLRSRFNHFEWASDEQEGSFECSLDGAAYEPCETGLHPYADREGSHTFRVRARDSSGNVDPTPATRTWRFDSTLQPPDNSSYAAAAPISGSSGRVTGTITGIEGPGGTQVGLPGAQNPGGQAVWYSWTAPATGTVTFDTAGSEADTVLGALRGTTGEGPALRMGDDDDGGPGRASRLSFTARAGETYRIGVDGYNDALGGDWFHEGTGFVSTGGIVLAWTFAPRGSPIAETGEALGVEDSTAFLFGEVDPNGSATTYRFEYGPTTAYGSSTPATAAGSGHGGVEAQARLAGLRRGATYHYRLVASNASGTVRGADRTFRTLASRPFVDTRYATNVTTNGARLNGTVHPHSAPTQYRFEWGRTEDYGASTPVTSAGSGTETVPVSAALTGLRAKTVYHYRLVATNESGTHYGEDFTLATTGSGPRATTLPVVDRTATAAGVRARVSSGADYTTVRFQYGLTTAYGSVKWAPRLSPWSDDEVAVGVTGLAPATTYHARVIAANPSGATYGEDVTFTTRHLPPVADTTAATALAYNRATLNGKAHGSGLAGTTWFEFGRTTAYGAVTPEQPLAAGSSPVATSARAFPLLPGRTYHARLVVETAEGRTRGDDVVFTTPG